LLELVQRCSGHGIDYARPEPSNRDVVKLARALSVHLAGARLAMDEAARARSALIRFNFRLAASVARKFTHKGLDFASLLTEASAGIADAIDRFDSKRDCKLSSYAIHYALRNVRRCVIEEGRTVQLPPHVHYKLSSLLKAKEEILAGATASKRTGLLENTDAMVQALAEYTGTPAETVQTILSCGLPAIDLDRTLFDGQSPDDYCDHILTSNEVWM
jgi:DNA-directed RNA polymerase sigma subunit (sigma70/sigma32)